MYTCTNCTRQYSCGCAKRVASDGTAACQLCLTDYERQLQARLVAANPHPIR